MSDQHYTDPVSRSGLKEREYLLRRAEEHRKLAEKSDEPGLRAIHFRFQQLYTKRANLVIVVLPD